MLSMFNVPFAIFDCIDWENKKQKLNELSQSQQIICEKQSDHTPVATDFYENDEGQSYCEEIAELFKREIHAFYNQLQIQDSMKISQAWFEFADQGMYHPTHNHGAIGYSAICYIDFDPKLHSSTTFIAPYNNFMNGQMLKCKLDVTEGTLIFFPSVIHHYSTPNISDVTRKILSFNMIPELMLEHHSLQQNKVPE